MPALHLFAALSATGQLAHRADEIRLIQRPDRSIFPCISSIGHGPFLWSWFIRIVGAEKISSRQNDSRIVRTILRKEAPICVFRLKNSLAIVVPIRRAPPRNSARALANNLALTFSRAVIGVPILTSIAAHRSRPFRLRPPGNFPGLDYPNLNVRLDFVNSLWSVMSHDAIDKRPCMAPSASRLVRG